MIITRSWLNEWIDLKGISTENLLQTLNSIGLEVDRVHTYDVPKKIVFGKVLECVKHPDADKLSVCQVDIGVGVCQIVCGASNVRAGLIVAVATLGAVMPSGLVIKPVKLRDVDSEGMICSASEIGFESFQDGIMEIDSSIGEFAIGQELSQNSIFSDTLIEIELTANRGDCLSVRGVARDLSAAFDRALKEFKPVDNENKRGIGRILNISHEKELKVNIRYKAFDLKELQLPFLMKLRLAQIGEIQQNPIESLVQYAMQSIGVLLSAYNHAYFCEKNEIMAKFELSEDENGYASIFGFAREKASTLGVIQEEHAKVNYNEGTVLLEASYLKPEVISKKMAQHKMNSTSLYYRASRGSEPDLGYGLAYCIYLIETNSNSSTFSGSIEYGSLHKETIISINKQTIDEIIGTSIDKLKVTKIFKNLGFNTEKSTADGFVISVPQFRHDIINKQDIAEEIVRLVGIDNIPSKPFIFTEKNRLKDDYFEYKKRTIFRHRAAQSGFFESVHFVFDEKKVLQEYGFETTLEELELLNPIVNTLDTLRPTLLTGLLRAASHNVKNGYSCVKLFEIGSVFSPTRAESLKFSILFSGDKEASKLSNAGKPQKVDFAYFTQKISDIIGAFELAPYETKHILSHIYQSAQVLIEGEVVGELFRVHPSVESSYDLEVTYACELDFAKIPYALKKAKKSSKYQASFRDLSILVPKTMSYESIKSVIQDCNIEELLHFYPVDKYSDTTLGENMSLSIRFMLQSPEKTLQEEDITSSMSAILNALSSELGIGLR